MRTLAGLRAPPTARRLHSHRLSQPCRPSSALPVSRPFSDTRRGTSCLLASRRLGPRHRALSRRPSSDPPSLAALLAPSRAFSSSHLLASPRSPTEPIRRLYSSTSLTHRQTPSTRSRSRSRARARPRRRRPTRRSRRCALNSSDPIADRPGLQRLGRHPPERCQGRRLGQDGRYVAVALSAR